MRHGPGLTIPSSLLVGENEVDVRPKAEPPITSSLRRAELVACRTWPASAD